jgi:hypothetical protein
MLHLLQHPATPRQNGGFMSYDTERERSRERRKQRLSRQDADDIVCINGRCKTPNACRQFGERCISKIEQPGQMFDGLPDW